VTVRTPRPSDADTGTDVPSILLNGSRIEQPVEEREVRIVRSSIVEAAHLPALGPKVAENLIAFFLGEW
jgi:hypothetical protein